ncbi:MAG: septum formation initiator family protein [Candidatus Eisenbacteria bacterium]|nr:septum formation initiator family protein [Candidatus Eisenbacteria bacterium]
MTPRRSPERLCFLRIDLRATFARRRFLRLAAVLIGLWVAYTFLLSEHSLIRTVRLKRENGRLQAAIERTRAETDSLRTLSDRIREDPEAIERIAREQFHLQREGERTYVFLPLDEAEREGILREAERSEADHASDLEEEEGGKEVAPTP